MERARLEEIIEATRRYDGNWIAAFVGLEEIAAMARESMAREDEIRRLKWSSHGHRGIYGDDGEMQCGECAPYGCVDYKREPLDKVDRAYRMALYERVPKEGSEG